MFKIKKRQKKDVFLGAVGLGCGIGWYLRFFVSVRRTQAVFFVAPGISRTYQPTKIFMPTWLRASVHFGPTCKICHNLQKGNDMGVLML